MRKKTDTAAMFVPEAQQPYKIPDNWRWVRLGTVCDFVGGGTPSKKNPAYWNGSIPWASVKDVKGSYLTDTIDTITEAGLQNSASNLCDVGDLILITRIEPAKTVIAKIVTAINQDLKIVKSPLSSLFLHYYFRAFQQSFLDMASGSTVLGITISNVENAAFPLPPLAEQQRIVERIESLFAKLDAAREKAQAVVDGFELRKAAILYRAFTGELTKQWRKTHGLRRSDWKHCQFRELCKIVRGGSPRPAGDLRYYNGNIPFMKVADITNNPSPYVSVAEHTIKEAGLKKTRMISANTLLLTNSGATLGVPAICTFNTTINDGIAAFLNLDSEFLLFYYYFWLGKTQELRSINMGMAQPNLNTNIIGNVEIDLPTDIEKREIVRIVSATLSRQEQAKNTAQEIIERIDAMKKAILGRAFRGELGTNDPSEASPDV